VVGATIHLDPNGAFAELGRTKLTETDLDGVLGKVADLAKRTIVGVDEASVTLVRGKSAHTAAYTGDLALNLGEWQDTEGGGPYLDAATSGATLSVPNLAGETRRPDYTPHAIHATSSWPSVAAPPEEAFAILSKLSQDTNRKVREVATTLVAGAHRPRR
jgi:hypothetical protein